MAKKNQDGLAGGTLVSESDHLRVMTQKRKQAAVKAKADAEAKAAAAVEQAGE